MSCHALALQPVNGNDILLQSREWFPPARASNASTTFRRARAVYSGRGQSLESLEAFGVGMGDDAITASTGQVVLGKEDKYRVVYRLVSAVYVLGITSADDENNNVFECAATVNQAVSVLVAACKGIDVTADKLMRKYTEVYMALDMVLHGVSTARLGTILATMHGEGLQSVVTGTDLENRARGASQWSQFKGQSVARIANIDVFAAAMFELPEETLAAGDEVAAALGPPLHSAGDAAVVQKPPEPKKPVSEDPFEASTALIDPQNIAGDFQKSKEAPSDPTLALAGLEVTATIAPETAAESTYVGLEGFEGDYGGVDFEAEDDGFSGLGAAFEGLDGAFGGGLDVSEYDGALKTPLDKGLAGLEELQGGGGKKADSAVAENAKSTAALGFLAASDAAGGVEPVAAAGPPQKESLVVSLAEEFFAVFDGLQLARVGLQGTLKVKTPSSGQESVEFSFNLEGAAGIKKAVLKHEFASNVGEGLYHVRVPPVDGPVTVLRYRLEPRFTPIPLRVRLVTSKSNTSITFLVQYVANPYLPGVLKDVAFIASLPSSPTFVKMSPHGYLDRKGKQVKWIIPEISAASQGRLRAQLPRELVGDPYDLDFSDEKAEREKNEEAEAPKITVRVEFSYGGQTLSGIVVNPVGHAPELELEHSYKVAKLQVLE